MQKRKLGKLGQELAKPTKDDDPKPDKNGPELIGNPGSMFIGGCKHCKGTTVATNYDNGTLIECKCRKIFRTYAKKREDREDTTWLKSES